MKVNRQGMEILTCGLSFSTFVYPYGMHLFVDDG